MIYRLTYEYDRSGGNVQYQTKKRVNRAIEDVEHATLLRTGLSLAEEVIRGLAYVRIDETESTEKWFVEADDARQVETVGELPVGNQSPPSATVSEDGEHVDDSGRKFESWDETPGFVDRVNTSPGSGFVLDGTLRPCNPFETDRWFVGLPGQDTELETPLTTGDIVSFYEEYADMYDSEVEAYLSAYRETGSQKISLFVARALTADQLVSAGPYHGNRRCLSNLHRLELSKAALVVGKETHGPGKFDATFQNGVGEVITSRQLAYRDWCGEATISYHRLGVLVDGDLYRPVFDEGKQTTTVSDSLPLTTHRGSSGTPWQFGLTRTTADILLTMARAGPEKFDPVFKRFRIESLELDEPLIVSNAVSRRLWKEDPENPHVTSSRTEGKRFRLLYRDGAGWHLARPDPSDGFPDAGSDSAFEVTSVPGVEVHSTGIRSGDDSDRKSTIEREYRITPNVVKSHESVYVLVYEEIEEESMDRLQWDVSNAIAYELHTENDSVSGDLAEVDSPEGVPRDQYIEAVSATREYIHKQESATKSEIIASLDPADNYPFGHNGVAARTKGLSSEFLDWWWQQIVLGLDVLADTESADAEGFRWHSV